MESAPGPKVSISIEKFRRLKEENAQLKEELALCHKYQNVPHGGGRKTRRGGYRIRWGRSIEKDFKPLDFVRGETYKIKLSNGSDFGGGKEGRETPYRTAVREGWEESAGFLGTKQDIRNLIKHHKVGRVHYNKYTTYLVQIPYDAHLPKKFSAHFKRNKRENPDVVYNKNGLFEKDKLMWLSFDKLREKMHQFRPFYRGVVCQIIKECKK